MDELTKWWNSLNKSTQQGFLSLLFYIIAQISWPFVFYIISASFAFSGLQKKPSNKFFNLIMLGLSIISLMFYLHHRVTFWWLY